MSSCFILEEQIKRWKSIETHWMMIKLLLLLLKLLFCERLTVFQQLQYIMGFIYSFSMKKLEDESKAMFSSNMQSKEYSQSLSCFLQSAQLHSKLFPLMSQTCSGKHDGTVVFILMGLKKVKYALVMFCQIIRCSIVLMYYRWLHGISGTSFFCPTSFHCLHFTPPDSNMIYGKYDLYMHFLSLCCNFSRF